MKIPFSKSFVLLYAGFMVASSKELHHPDAPVQVNGHFGSNLHLQYAAVEADDGERGRYNEHYSDVDWALEEGPRLCSRGTARISNTPEGPKKERIRAQKKKHDVKLKEKDAKAYRKRHREWTAEYRQKKKEVDKEAYYMRKRILQQEYRARKKAEYAEARKKWAYQPEVANQIGGEDLNGNEQGTQAKKKMNHEDSTHVGSPMNYVNVEKEGPNGSKQDIHQKKLENERSSQVDQTKERTAIGAHNDVSQHIHQKKPKNRGSNPTEPAKEKLEAGDRGALSPETHQKKSGSEGSSQVDLAKKKVRKKVSDVLEQSMVQKKPVKVDSNRNDREEGRKKNVGAIDPAIRKKDRSKMKKPDGGDPSQYTGAKKLGSEAFGVVDMGPGVKSKGFRHATMKDGLKRKKMDAGGSSQGAGAKTRRKGFNGMDEVLRVAKKRKQKLPATQYSSMEEKLDNSGPSQRTRAKTGVGIGDLNRPDEDPKSRINTEKGPPRQEIQAQEGAENDGSIAANKATRSRRKPSRYGADSETQGVEGPSQDHAQHHAHPVDGNSMNVPNRLSGTPRTDGTRQGQVNSNTGHSGQDSSKPTQSKAKDSWDAPGRYGPPPGWRISKDPGLYFHSLYPEWGLDKKFSYVKDYFEHGKEPPHKW